MSWSITLPALSPSRWTSTIVGFMSRISTTKTFKFSCARIPFVIRLSAHTIHSTTIHFTTDLTTSSFDWTGLFFRFLYRISLNCGSAKFRPFWTNLRRSSCDKQLLTTWSRICSSTVAASPNSQVWAFCLSLVANCSTVSFASWLVSRKQSLSYGTFACSLNIYSRSPMPSDSYLILLLQSTGNKYLAHLIRQCAAIKPSSDGHFWLLFRSQTIQKLEAIFPSVRRYQQFLNSQTALIRMHRFFKWPSSSPKCSILRI